MALHICYEEKKDTQSFSPKSYGPHAVEKIMGVIHSLYGESSDSRH